MSFTRQMTLIQSGAPNSVIGGQISRDNVQQLTVTTDSVRFSTYCVCCLDLSLEGVESGNQFLLI